MDLNNTSNNSMEKTKEKYLGKLVISSHACKRVKTKPKQTQKATSLKLRTMEESIIQRSHFT